MKRYASFVVGTILAILAAVLSLVGFRSLAAQDSQVKSSSSKDPMATNALKLVTLGRNIFRFDTFGDEAFWGGVLKLHTTIEGAANGGVGPGLSPKQALTFGLKVDSAALPPGMLGQFQNGQLNLDDPAVTLTLLKLNAVVGVTGFFDTSGVLQSVGIQCALCHSTVDNSQPALCGGLVTPNPGTGCVGRRLDG